MTDTAILGARTDTLAAEATGISVLPLHGLPMFAAGDSLAGAISSAAARNDLQLRDGDICVVAQKIVSKAEGRLIDLGAMEPGADAREIAQNTGRDPAMVQAILEESAEIMRATPAAIIARHRTGHVLANAGIDLSNVEGGSEGMALAWPANPDTSARLLRSDLLKVAGVRMGVVIADSMGRAWRLGTLGTAIGCAGLMVLDDRRGKATDLFGRPLQATVIAIADTVAAMAGLVMGEGDEGIPVAILRGAARWTCEDDGPGAAASLRPAAQDMFR